MSLLLEGQTTKAARDQITYSQHYFHYIGCYISLKHWERPSFSLSTFPFCAPFQSSFATVHLKGSAPNVMLLGSSGQFKTSLFCWQAIPQERACYLSLGLCFVWPSRRNNHKSINMSDITGTPGYISLNPKTTGLWPPFWNLAWPQTLNNAIL